MHGAAIPSKDGDRRAVVLSTGRLHLAPVVADDLEQLWHLHADPRAFTHDSTAPLTARQQMDWVLETWIEHWRRHGTGYVTIRARDPDQLGAGLLGVVGLTHLGQGERTALIAYWRLLPWVQGQGVAAEAMGAVLDHPRYGPAGREVLAITAAGNAPSRTLAERLGFVEARNRTVPGAGPTMCCWCCLPRLAESVGHAARCRSRYPAHMSVSELSASSQNYLKALWNLQEWSEQPVTATVLAAKVGVRLSTASDAVKKLTGQGLLAHTPYGAVSLTDEGRAYAVAMVRRHRLLETFLVSVLGYRWDQVHDEAETLEHAVSDFMIERIDEYLDHPDRDPHGDPIPAADGTVHRLEAIVLTGLEPGRRARVERISDADPELLQFFAQHRIGVGTDLETRAGSPFSGALGVLVDGEQEVLPLGAPATDAVWIKPEM